MALNLQFLNRSGDRVFAKQQTREDLAASQVSPQKSDVFGPDTTNLADPTHLTNRRPGSHRLVHRFTEMAVGVRPVHNVRYNHPMTGANK